MDIEKHFLSYRVALSKDALEGYQDYAKATPTAKPQDYPTVFDYLNYALNNVRAAVLAKNEQDYRAWLQRHRLGMVSLFEKMVYDVLPEEITPIAIYDLILKKGWKWFKFAPLSVGMEMTLQKATPEKVWIYWVPRYDPKFTTSWECKLGGAAFDADELAQFWKLGTDPHATTWPAIEFKKTHPGQKFIKVDVKDVGGTGFYKPIGQVNSGDTVVDWTLSLF